MGPHHDFVSITNQRFASNWVLLIYLQWFRDFEAQFTNFSDRSDEIRYVWQVKGRWTIAMALFGLVRGYHDFLKTRYQTFVA